MEGLPPPARFYTAKKSTPSGERSTVKIVTFFSLPPPPQSGTSSSHAVVW